MGILTNLIEANARQNIEKKKAAAEGYKTILTSENATPQMQAFAREGLLALTDDLAGVKSGGGSSGGGGKGGGKGGQGGKDHPLRQVFGHLIDGISNLNPAGPSRGTTRELKGIAAKAPKPGERWLSDEDVQRIEDAKQKAIDDEKVRMDTAIQEGKNKADEDLAKRSESTKREMYTRNIEEDLGYAKGTPEFKAAMAQKLGLTPKVPKETATDIAEQAYADAEGKPKKELTAAEKITAVRAARGSAKAPTKEEVAYAEKHGKKPEELTGSEKLLAVKEARETERLPQRPALQSGMGGTGSDISDDELRSLAEKEILTNYKPSFGLGKSAVRDRYNKIMADVWASDPDSAEARAAYRAGTANLTQLTRLKGQVSSFETAFELDADNAQDAAKDVPRTSMRKFNSVAQLLEQNWTDDPALATLAVNVQTVVNQYARLVSSATGGGVSTDSARQEAMAVLDKSMASGSFSAAINRMKLEARNRITGLNKEIESAKTGMRRGGDGSNKGNAGSAQPKTADELLKSLGKGQ